MFLNLYRDPSWQNQPLYQALANYFTYQNLLWDWPAAVTGAGPNSTSQNPSSP